MKKRMCAAVCALLMCLACAASASTSVMLTETSLGMNLEGFSGTEARVLTLKAGDALFLSVVERAGAITVRIRQEGGDTVYEGDGATPAGSYVEIPADGAYRISVTGVDASGTVWAGLLSQTETDEAEGVPGNRQMLQSELGYMMEYDPDLFAYQADADEDVFTLRSPDAEAAIQPSMRVRLEDGAYDALADALFMEVQDAGGMAVEFPPSVIDWRPVRTFQIQNAQGQEGLVEQISFVEADANKTFKIFVIYSSDDAGTATKMQNMISSLMFMF
ncbi:hypothetical protein LJC74_04350 [Eubacteriales bacterium OttesenSCG-928-A19]|nr:hypothetical protein [Eubacteriales bacterium OttesenSCG-928-A19]